MTRSTTAAYLLAFIVLPGCLVIAQPPTSGTKPPAAAGATAPGSTPAGTSATTSTSSSSTSCPTGYGVSTQTVLTDGTLSITTTSCPPYSPYNQTTPNTPKCQSGSVAMKAYWPPIISTTATYVSITFSNGSTNPNGGVGGTIGISMTGIYVFADGDAEKRDAYVVEGSTFDTCRGHASPGGGYHYHTMPGTGCAYNDTAGQHSPVFALMADGIPLFGALGDNGTVPSNLDDCGGHTDNTYAFYHYHLPNGLVSPYTVRCLKGCLAQSLAGGSTTTPTCTRSSTQYDYSKFTVPWVTGFSADQSPCKSGSTSTNSTTSTPTSTSTTPSTTSPGSSSSSSSADSQASKPSGSTGSGSSASTPAASNFAASSASSTARSVLLSLSLNGVDYNAVANDATKMAALKTGVCAAAVARASTSGVNNVTCTVTSVAPGSVVVGVQLTSTDSASSNLQSAAQTFASDPASSFSSSFTSTFSVTSYSATVQTTDDSSSTPIGAIVGGVVGGVAGLVLLAVVAVVLLKRKKAGVSPDTQRDDRQAMLNGNNSQQQARSGQIYPV